MRTRFSRLLCLAALAAAVHAHALSPLVPIPPLVPTPPLATNADLGLAGKPTPWRHYNGSHFRLESPAGDMSCFSLDGQNCSKGAPSAANEANWRPLTCGVDHASRWGTTGYDTPGHWCNVAYANVFAKWQIYSLLGFDVRLAQSPNNDPMCHSFNGVNCEWGLKRSPTTFPVNPVVCGKAHLRRHGVTGYEEDRKDHWCQTPQIVALLDSSSMALDPPQAGNTTSLAFVLPSWTTAEGTRFLVANNAKAPLKVLMTDAEGRTHVAQTFGTDGRVSWSKSIFSPRYEAGWTRSRMVIETDPLPATTLFEATKSRDQFIRPSPTADTLQPPNRLVLQYSGQANGPAQPGDKATSAFILMLKDRLKPKS